MNLLVIVEVLVALVFGFLAYVYWDVESRRRKFIQSGIPVLHQPVHFMGVVANLLPRNKFFMWLLPHRYPGIERTLSGCFQEFDSNLVAFISFRFQEVFTNDPKVIKDIAVTRRKEFPKPSAPYDILRLFGENVVTAVDEEGEWKKHRMIVGPAFSEGNNALVAESTVLHLNRIMANWKKDLKDGKVSVDMDAEMVRLALAVIGQAGLGLDLSTATDLVPAKSGEMHKMSLRDSLQNVCKYLVPRLIMPRLLLQIPFGIFKVIRVSFDEFQTYMKDFCEERTASLNQRGATKDRETLADSSAVMDAESEQRKETKRTDLLTKLLENNTVLTTDEIFGDIFIFLVAGHETTAHTLGWAVRLLAVYREKQEKLYKEAVSVLGDRDPTYEDYENLVYARCVFKESLRLFPQVNGIVKWTEEGNVLSGHTIPPKTMLAFLSPSVHIHPKYWESPAEFMPERFDHREPGHKAPDPYAFIPFAVGRRSCLGSKFAQVEGTLALAMLAKNWTFELPPDCTDKNFIFESMFLLTQQAKNQIPFVLKPRGKQE